MARGGKVLRFATGTCQPSMLSGKPAARPVHRLMDFTWGKAKAIRRTGSQSLRRSRARPKSPFTWERNENRLQFRLLSKVGHATLDCKPRACTVTQARGGEFIVAPSSPPETRGDVFA